MIEIVQEIVTENPIREIWKRIRYFLDIPYVSELIRKRHKIEKRKFDSDIKKQAQQINYSILQAEEYFSASENVSLPTRPLLIYYGATSLSKALVLLIKNGSYSYDALRKKNKHQHHGLELSKDILGDSKAITSINGFLNSISCNVYKNKLGQPWGHFPIFYDTLYPTAYKCRKEIYNDLNFRTFWTLIPMNGPKKIDLSTICEKKLVLINLMQSIPDLHNILSDFKIPTQLAIGNVMIREYHFQTESSDRKKSVETIKYVLEFIIDEIDASTKLALFSYYKELNPEIKIIGDFERNLNFSIEYSADITIKDQFLPEIIEDINSRIYYLLSPKEHMIEPASQLAILFCLGMVSRYYPEIWMRCTQENIMLAEIVDSLLNIIYRKFPNMILDQMTGIKHFIHN